MQKVGCFILFFCLALISCEDNELLENSLLTVSEEVLIGCWTDSFEENQDNSDMMVYRPCDFTEFPASRYRHTMELREDGKCSWLYLAPNDAHYWVHGTWVFEGENQLIKIFNVSGKPVYKFRITEKGEDFIKVEYYQEK